MFLTMKQVHSGEIQVWEIIGSRVDNSYSYDARGSKYYFTPCVSQIAWLPDRWVDFIESDTVLTSLNWTEHETFLIAKSNTSTEAEEIAQYWRAK